MESFLNNDNLFKLGESVCLINPENQKKTLKLEAKTVNTRDGELNLEEIVNKKEGYELVSKTGTKFIVIRPRLSDATLSLPRGAAIIYPKDASVILTYGDFFPGARVLECGLGSGALTIPLLRAVGEKGKVVSVERREDFFKNAKKNVEQFFQGSTSGGPELLNAWQPELVEFQEFLEKTVQKFDRVALDLLNPWEFVKQLEKVLVSGAVVSFYVTNTGQLSSLSKALNCSKETDNELTTESKLQGSWKDIEAFEIIRRPWQLDSIALRPEHQGILHSGFVVIAKFVE